MGEAEDGTDDEGDSKKSSCNMDVALSNETALGMSRIGGATLFWLASERSPLSGVDGLDSRCKRLSRPMLVRQRHRNRGSHRRSRLSSLASTPSARSRGCC